MNRADAFAKLDEWVASPSLRRHCETVGHVMRRAAAKYGETGDIADEWEVAGLLHDADYEKFPAEHPRRIVAWLRERNEESTAYAIECHASFLNVPCKSMMDKSLVACDELTGFIVAVALMRPDGVLSLEPPSVIKKLKDKKFAAGVHRDDVTRGAGLLGVELSEHIRFVVASLQERAIEFELAGQLAK